MFGASGTIGKALTKHLLKSNVELLKFSTNSRSEEYIFMDESKRWLNSIESNESEGNASAIVFCQGANTNDNILNYPDFNEIFAANVTFILNTLHELLINRKIQNVASIVIISSIWQDLSKSNKLSYTISKSAVKGLVNSLVADLSSRGIRINAVLPGVIDSEMTRKNLKPEQIQSIEAQTPVGSLISADQVANVIEWLCSAQSSGVTGQFITVDNGWSNVRSL